MALDKPSRVYTDTPTGKPTELTDDQLNNLADLFKELKTIRDANKTPE